MNPQLKHILLLASTLLISANSYPQETLLLRQPSISETHIAFTYGGDVWVAGLEGQDVTRITSMAAVEQRPVISSIRNAHPL